MKRITPNLRTALFKALIVLVPSYTVAFLTDKMVFVVPTLAAAGFFASTIETRDVTRLLDEGPDAEDSVDNIESET